MRPDSLCSLAALLVQRPYSTQPSLACIYRCTSTQNGGEWRERVVVQHLLLLYCATIFLFCDSISCLSLSCLGLVLVASIHR